MPDALPRNCVNRVHTFAPLGKNQKCSRAQSSGYYGGGDIIEVRVLPAHAAALPVESDKPPFTITDTGEKIAGYAPAAKLQQRLDKSKIAQAKLN